ncbi:MAG: Ribosomal RNA small subunit methyltransferase B [Candidatus Heimdallarchaeota archaeon LC_3]|nr:MAG: Ribosomal RNA small subunit methyltransferase B [Candidatus Heimdallarchaeota archaeon LC_3]
MTISIPEVKYIIKILSRSEQHSSIRNEFYSFFSSNKKLKKNRKLYNTVYHLTIEISRKKNWIDEIIRFQNLKIDISSEVNSRLISFYRLMAFLFFEEEYLSNPPDAAYFKRKIPDIFSHTNKKNHRIIASQFDKLMSFSTNNWYDQNPSKIKRLSMKFFHPEWFVEYLSNFWPIDEVEEFLRRNNDPKESDLRVISDNKLNFNQTVENLIEKLKKNQINVDQDSQFRDILHVNSINKIPIISSKPFLNNDIVIQSKISSIISHLLHPMDHELILDMTSAPGMKSSHIANLMGENSKIISVDISKKRIFRLLNNLRKFTNKMFSVVHAEAGYSIPLPFKSNSMDKILIDAPCSSTGIFWKYPDHKWHGKEKIQIYAKIQQDLLIEGLRVLKLGGIGVYSVCSIHYLEGEAIIDTVLDRIELLDPEWGNEGSTFPETIEKKQFSEKIIRYCRRTYSHIDNTDCFFIAKFKKKS